MPKIILTGLFIIHCSLFTRIFAQPKTDSLLQTAVANPKLIVALNRYKNNSKVSVADCKKALQLNPTLILKDEKGVSYTVTSFEFTWRQRSVSDDVKTGKPKVSYTSVGQKFKGNKLDVDWVKEITETLNAGDQFNFNTILYLDAKKNKTFLAPDLKIDVIN